MIETDVNFVFAKFKKFGKTNLLDGDFARLCALVYKHDDHEGLLNSLNTASRLGMYMTSDENREFIALGLALLDADMRRHVNGPVVPLQENYTRYASTL